VHRGASIDGDFFKLGVGSFPHPFSHATLHPLQLPR
jgi:hypothetical protein